MNTILANLLAGAKNVHVSVPIYLAIACEIAPIWLPQYEAQIKHTQKVLIFYGLMSASNSPGAPATPPPPAPPTQTLLRP